MLDGSHALVLSFFFTRRDDLPQGYIASTVYTRFGHFDFFSRTGISRIPVFQYPGPTGDRLPSELALPKPPAVRVVTSLGTYAGARPIASAASTISHYCLVKTRS